jgi:hypothetical protein
MDYTKSFDHENNFYLTAQSRRMGRAIAHYELFKKTLKTPGEIVECGVFKGVSLLRFVMFQQLFQHKRTRKIIGFDTFGDFPSTAFEADKVELDIFIQETGGGKSSSVEELTAHMANKQFTDYELVKGDICLTVPEYIEKNSNLKISLPNIDTDIYEPAQTIIEYLAPRVVKGGIILFDDYDVFSGETQIADAFCEKHKLKIKKFDFINVPAYVVI